MSYRDVDLQVRCPYCRAALGHRCRKLHPTRNLGFTKNPHKARARLADESLLSQPENPPGR